MNYNLIILFFLTFGIISCNSKSNDDLEIETPPEHTQFKIINESNESVKVWITLGATPGCIQNVSLIPFITDSTDNLKGYFMLDKNDSTIAYAPSGRGINGNVSFNTPPLNCPNEEFPNGVNLFEFIINNSFQGEFAQETVDISCVSGVNSKIEGKLSGGTQWSATSDHPDVKYMYNGGIDGNKGLVGVYPYGCDTCTGAKSPPACITVSSDKQSTPICNVQRSAKNAGGGIIRIVYKGAL
ncbi:MAG: hypothetical protein C0598_10410 [Marinilabiliales bacterium]|nr:MAG: hypothetical protein C0598_10410 [Marinilabiliales bacterium]